MNNLLTFSIIGGDMRQLYAASLLSLDGHIVRVFGFNNSLSIEKNIHISNSIEDCVNNANAVILPMPYSISGGNTINAPLNSEIIYTDDVISHIDNPAILFAGKSNDYLKNICNNKNITCIDYSLREELAVMNAIPTAEGALAIALNNTSYTLRDSKCLVIGYGRIGKILSELLKNTGAYVTPTARKHSDLAWIYANGYIPKSTSSIPSIVSQYDIIFNTVPHLILDFKALSSTKDDVLIIDLASRPGGVDFDTAHKLNRKVIQALSLPGKVAPYTSGKIIKNTIINILDESEVPT